jgi:hypothetical protein
MPQVTSSKYLVMAGWNDVPHLDEKTKRELLESTPAHQRDARSKGIPVLGSGRIFPLDEELIKVNPFAIPAHWPRIAGLDFGWDHPTAAGWLAWDRDTDTVYLYDIHRLKEQTPAVHSLSINSRGTGIPVAWPHDGLQHDKGSGEALAAQYRKQGVNMLKYRATHAPGPGEKEGEGGNGVEAGVMEMLARMESGRFKVFSHLEPFFEEFRLYHRKDGMIVKVFDDILSAVRYALMMLRHAKVNMPKRAAPIQTFTALDPEVGY